MAGNRARIGGLVIGVNVLLAAIWWLVPLWMYGVFDDGLFYGSIARNLVYDAQGGLWDLKVSNALDPNFNGHPPMSFWLEALFFKFFGDLYWVDRVYSLVLALVSLVLLAACWCLWLPKGTRLPLLFWLLVPVVGWSFSNNMLENLLTVTTGAAVYLLLRQAKQKSNNWLWVFLAGLFIVMGVLTKGPVGLYPLAVPILYALVLARERWCRALLESVLLVVVLIGSYFLLTTCWPRADVFLERYWNGQLMGALLERGEFTAGRWLILRVLVQEFLPSFLVGLGFLAGARYLKLATLSINKKTALFFLLLGLSASLPMLLSYKQWRFYIVPSMSWFALAWGFVCWPSFLALAEYTQAWKRRKNTFRSVIGLGIIACLTLSYLNIGKNARRTTLFDDALLVGQHLSPHSELYISKDLYEEWGLHGYFYRYFYIDLTMNYHEQHYAIGLKGKAFPLQVFEPTSDSLTTLQLYQHKK